MANEFLQEVFGSEALTFDQFSEKLGDRTLADLSTGEYVGKHKFDAMETKYNGANDLLAEANAKLEGYDPEWKTKMEGAQAEADAKAMGILKAFAVNSAVAAAGTIDPEVVAMLIDREKVTIDGETVSGISEQIEELRKNKPHLFEDNGGRAKFTKGTSGGRGTSDADAAVEARYANNPWYIKK